MNFNGNFKYAQSKDSSDIFSQNYSFFHAIKPTNKMTINTSIRYNKAKKGVRRIKIFTPTVSMNVSNDIFNLNMSGTKSETIDTHKNDISSYNYNFNFSSFYKKIVNLKAFYTNSKTKDDGSPKRIFSKSDSWGIKLQKDFYKILNLSYDLKKYSNNNKITGDKSFFTTDSILTGLSGVKFTYKKFSFKFSSNFNYKREIMKSKILDIGYAKFPVFFNITWFPTINENKILLDNQEIILQLNQELDIIYFYINGDLLENVPEDVRWDIYWKKDLNDSINDWEIIDSNVSLPYKFSSTFQKKGYIKLKVVTLPDKNIELEHPIIEGYILKKSSGNYAKYVTQNRNFRSDFSVFYDFSEKIKTNYRFNYNRNIPDPGNISETSYQSITLNFLKSSLLLSQNSKKTKSDTDTKSTSISFSSSGNILPTLSFAGSISHSINEEDGKKISKNDSTSISVNASIFPDLTMRWSNSFNMNKIYHSNEKVEKNYSSNVGITARFTDKFTMTSNYSFSKSFTKGIINQTLLFNASWRISDYLFFNGSENFTFPDEGVTNIFHHYTVWFALTKKIQTNISYSGIRGDTRVDTFSNFISWRISNKVSSKFSYNKTFSRGEDKWNSLISLNVTF